LPELTDEERADFFDPSPSSNGYHESEQEQEQDGAPDVSYGALFDAPDFSTLIRGRRPTGAREYENKVKSGMKSATMAAMRAGDLPDAAAILKFGPGFAAATGDVCAVNDKAKKMVDMITAPENPYVSLALATLPFVAQLIRNHEAAFDQIPETRKQAKELRKQRKAAMNGTEDTRRTVSVGIPFMKREIKIRVGVKIRPFAGLRKGIRTGSHPPETLIMQVFSDEKLIAALEKQGIRIVQQNPM
jgi:hypothetical protein